MESEKPFARAENGELRGQHVRWLICGDLQVKAWTLDQWAPDEMSEIINAAHDKAVREATEKLQAHNDHLQRMFNLPSARKDIAEAEARVWEEAAKIADGWANSRSCKAHDDNPCCHVRTGAGIASALRSKKSNPEPREGEGRRP